MKLADIPRPALVPGQSAELKLLIKNAPRCLKLLLERSVVFIEQASLAAMAPGDIRLLHGGINAVAYLVKRGDEYVVIKLDYRTIQAEAEALEAWTVRHAKVVKVRSIGKVNLDIGSAEPVRYAILQGITRSDSTPAPTAIKHIADHPASARCIGEAAGTQLAIMHGATTSRRFGEFADMASHSNKPFASWNSYLMSYVRHFEPLISELGYTRSRYLQLARTVRAMKFPRTGRYIHGDPSPRNILLQHISPLDIVLIDPNPIIGHPSWDLAIIKNNAEITRRKAQLRPKNKTYEIEAIWRRNYHAGVVAGYFSSTRRQVSSAQLRLVRLVQMLLHTELAMSAARRDGRNLVEDATVRAHTELLADLMAEVLPPLED